LKGTMQNREFDRSFDEEPADLLVAPEVANTHMPEPSIDQRLDPVKPSQASMSRRIAIAMAVIAMVILAGIVSSSYREWILYRNAREVASRSRATLESVNNLMAYLLDAETGQRGYLLTGDAGYLQPYRQAVERIPANLADLERLLVSPPEEQSRVRRLKELVDEKLSELDRTITLRSAQGPRPALQLVLGGEGKQAMDQIRESLAGIRAREYSSFLQGRQASEDAARKAFLNATGGSLILLILFVAGIVMLNRALRQREEAFGQAWTARDSLKTTLASIGDAVVSTDIKGRVVFANHVARSLLRMRENDILGKRLADIFQIVNEFTREKVEDPVTKVLRDGTVAGLANHTILIAPDGSEVPIDDSAAPIQGSGAAIQGVVLVFRDISGRRNAERDAAYLEAIVRSSNDAVVGKSIDGIIQSWNAGAEQIYGYQADEIIGRPMTDLIPPDRMHEEAEVLGSLRRGSGAMHLETVRRRKDGALIDVALTISPIRDRTGQTIGLSHVARDITEQKRTAENMRQMQKLESLGILAGGIAHDFNNLLVGIIGNASLALTELEKGSSIALRIEEVLTAGERAAVLTRQMLAYSGKGPFALERMDLSAQVRETLPLIHMAIPHTVEMKLDLADDLPAIEADSAQIQQLVMNAIINGAEAIPEGRPGIVSITTRLQNVDDRYLQSHAGTGKGELQPGAYVLVEIADTGCGMDEATKAKIFDPFFTTKFLGRGLGLSAALGIVLGHHGSIDVSSVPGLGTTLRVLLPAVDTAARSAPPEKLERADLSGRGMVLVVDDEEVVLRVAKDVLERHGYTVVLAEDGARAVETFRREGYRIVCVVLDLTMPVMGGEQALARIKELRADVPVILTSGFSEHEAVRRFNGKGLAGFLQKPYRAEGLLAMVKSVVRSSDSGC